MIRRVTFFLIFFLLLFNYSHGAISDSTKRRCDSYTKAMFNMLESVNNLDRGSRFYTSVTQIEKITVLLEETVKNLKKYEEEEKELDSYLKLSAFVIKDEELEPLVEMRKEMRYEVMSIYRLKLSKYLSAFKSLLLFSKDNIKSIKKGNSQLRNLYDRYYLNYKKEYDQFKKASKKLRKFIKQYYAKYEILEDIIPIPDRLFDDSIWILNKVKFFGK